MNILILSIIYEHVSGRVLIGITSIMQHTEF